MFEAELSLPLLEPACPPKPSESLPRAAFAAAPADFNFY